MRIENLTIDCLRGIRDLSLKDLQDVNLILGGNDAGKTTVLEAVMLSTDGSDVNQIVQCACTRARFGPVSQFELFLSLFPFSNSAKKTVELHLTEHGLQHHLKLCGQLVTVQREDSDKETNSGDASALLREIRVFSGFHELDDAKYPLEIPEDYRYKIYSEDGKVSTPGIYIAPFTHLFNNSSDAYRSKELEMKTVRLLQIIDPDIEGIKLEKSKYGVFLNQIIEHRKYGDVPLFTYGDGMRKTLMLAAAVARAENGVLLIDEIETSLQASLLSEIFSWLIKACRLNNVQLFATTHSIEAISALADCAEQDEECSLACYRLERRNGVSRSVRFSKDSLNKLVNRSGIDVR